MNTPLTPYEEGYRAYRNRAGVIDNPYPRGSMEHEQWYDGWRKADIDDGN